MPHSLTLMIAPATTIIANAQMPSEHRAFEIPARIEIDGG